MQPRHYSILGPLAVALLTALPAYPQDTHYWTEQFGNRSYLLSGAVVADPADLSAIYYNPGGLALNESGELLLAGLGLDFSGTTIRDALADGVDLGKSTTRFVPSLLAGDIPVGGEAHRFAYSVLTRHRSDLGMSSTLNVPGDALDVPDFSLVSNSLSLDSAISEYWLGGTWAYELRPNVGVGVTTFVAARDQRTTSSGLFQMLAAVNRAAVIDQTFRYKYRHWRALWKIGANTRFAGWSLGATITTPGVGLGGSGEVSANATVVSQIALPGGGPQTFVATDLQTEVSAEYRSPFSAAFGGSRGFGSTTLHVSGEWFEAVSLYDVVKARPFTPQTGGTDIDPAVREQLQRVFNVGVAAEHILGDGIRAYFGFHTDFSGSSGDPASNASFSKWDFYHVSGGATFPFNGNDVTLGANLALADETVPTDGRDPFRPIGLPDDTRISSYRLTLILGFNFSL